MAGDSGKKLFVGPRFRRIRQQLGLSQTQIAEGLGISPSYINLIERNQRPVTAQMLMRLAQTYDLDLRDLASADEVAQIEVIGLRQAHQHLRRHRALVALYQVDITWGNAEAFGDLGLRQPQLLADPPESGTHEQLFAGIACHWGLTDPC